ncbi:FxDxF family PEP-CTERM protein [Roseateles koreensis]|uniref:FxDxF family PEP-CTERM protein n=1 Tax=Roseateles koreensis TaxID=2987526 RepID=A0ABT5KNZ2_9BURK|nr:FxDxF family PEP-CTERM protein [Roseateles koreensis]MDC8784614.1 FxDxF family PEP-CTERM protein [Roseateles koreensis]
MKPQFLAAGVLALSSVSAFAANQTLNFTLVSPVGSAPVFAADFTGTPALLSGGTDVLTFTGLPFSSFDFSLSLQSQNVSWLTSTLNGTAIGFTAPLGKNKVEFGYVEGTSTPGFVLDLVGSTLSTAASYSGTLTVTAVGSTQAVPEPASYAMLLAGLGALGFVVRRRQVR